MKIVQLHLHRARGVTGDTTIFINKERSGGIFTSSELDVEAQELFDVLRSSVPAGILGRLYKLMTNNSNIDHGEEPNA